MVNLLKENGFVVEGMVFIGGTIHFTCKKDNYTFEYRMGHNGYNTAFLEKLTRILEILTTLKKEYRLVFDIKKIEICDKGTAYSYDDRGTAYSSSRICTEKGTYIDIIYRDSYYFLSTTNDEYRETSLRGIANAMKRKDERGLFVNISA